MMYNQSSDKVEWGHMKMPEIIIDSDNESTTKNYDNESYNNCFLKANREESNHLSCKSNLDDVDSGIHESNDIFLPGISSVLHSNRLSLRDMKKRSNLSEVRSYSTNCLSVDTNRFKEGFGMIDPRLCRNCSTKSHSKKQFDSIKRESNEIPYRINEIVKISETKPKINSRDSLQHRLCKIRVLLVCMKILLGSTMTGLGIFLLTSSKSIKVKDCAFWAGGPLFFSGLFEVFIYNWRNKLRKRMKMCYLMTIACGVISFICSILCLLSSIFSGVHGNWISGHSDNCFSKDDNNQNNMLLACCYDIHTGIVKDLKNSTCFCREARENIHSKPVITMTYENFNCRYVFSALKDYLILQCALMGIGSGVCLWLLQMTIQRLIQDCSTASQIRSSQQNTDDQNCVGQSPVIPLKIRCIQVNDKSQILSDYIREKSNNFNYIKQNNNNNNNNNINNINNINNNNNNRFHSELSKTKPEI